MSDISTITPVQNTQDSTSATPSVPMGDPSQTQTRTQEPSQTQEVGDSPPIVNKTPSVPDIPDVVLEKVIKTKQSSIADASLKHVEFSDEAKTPTKKTHNDDPRYLTKLVSIDGLSPLELNLDALRGFASRCSVPGTRKMCKRDVCEEIAKAAKNPPSVVAVKAETRKNAVNRKRYCNVIFSDTVRPLLMTRGESLSKADLTDGFKTDEILHRRICTEYNNSDNHNDDAHPHLKNCRGNPKTFAGPILWEQSKKTLRYIVKEYEQCFYNWKLSGNHGEFGDTAGIDQRIPFENFIQNNNSLLYLHEFVYQYPNIFSKVTEELPVGAFTESTGSESIASISAKKRKKQTPKSSAMEGWTAFNQSNEKKNIAVAYALLTKMSTDLTNSIQVQQALKRTLFQEKARETNRTLRALKDGYDKYKSNENSDDDDCSHQSLFEEVKFTESVVDQNKEQLKHVKSKIANLDSSVA